MRHEPADEQEARDLARVLELASTQPDLWLRSAPLHLTASALIIEPTSSQVLLRWHQRQQSWLHVGGHGEPGERDPLTVARREAAEETGLTDLVPWPDSSVLHLVIVPVPAGRGEPAHEHADVRFVLATSSPGAIRAESAHAPLRWLSVPDAAVLTAAANLRESLARLERLMAG